MPEGFLLLPGDGLLLVSAAGTVLHLDREARERLAPAAQGWAGADLASVWPELEEQLRRWPVASLEDGPVDLTVQREGGSWPIRLFRTDNGWGAGLLAPRSPEGLSRRDGEPHRALMQAVLREVWDAVVVTTAEPFDSPGPVIVYANPGVLRQSGHSLPSVLGRSPRMFQGPRTDPEASRRFRTALERWEPVRQEILNYRLDGSLFWLDIAITPLADADGWYTHWVSVQRDVSAAREISHSLEQSEQHFRLLAENVSDVVVRLAEDGTVLWVSPSLTPTLGWTCEEWLGQPIRSFLLPHEEVTSGLPRAESSSARQDRIRDGESVVTRDRLRARTGACHWVETHASPYRDAQGRIDGMVCSYRLVDEQVLVEQELARRARTDDLTGLLNRGEILARIDRLSLSMDHDLHSESVAVLFCDLDHFKAINDSHGHLAGDEVLRVVAQRIRSSLRSSDLAARVGGDELLVVLRGVSNMNNALAIAENLRRVICAPVPTPAGPLAVTVSIGVTLVQPGECVDDLIARADGAMYRGKRTGRNVVLPILATPSA